MAVTAPDDFYWSAPKVVLSLFLFLLAGLAEIGGGWLVWQAVRDIATGSQTQWWRDKRAVAYAVVGGCTLVAYGFIPTAQPPPNFGRLYAVYGGVFITLSFLWGWIVDKERPDPGTRISCSSSTSTHKTIGPVIACGHAGDWVGGTLAVAGVIVAWFWPR